MRTDVEGFSQMKWDWGENKNKLNVLSVMMCH